MNAIKTIETMLAGVIKIINKNYLKKLNLIIKFKLIIIIIIINIYN